MFSVLIIIKKHIAESFKDQNGTKCDTSHVAESTTSVMKHVFYQCTKKAR